MIRFLTSRRRLLRKRMYNAPHKRVKRTYYRENKNRVKTHQEEYKNRERPIKRRKRRPKREVVGYKMSYRYRALEDIIEEDEVVESSE